MAYVCLADDMFFPDIKMGVRGKCNVGYVFTIWRDDDDDDLFLVLQMLKILLLVSFRKLYSTPAR